jgi:hypothetical protein
MAKGAVDEDQQRVSGGDDVVGQNPWWTMTKKRDPRGKAIAVGTNRVRRNESERTPKRE